MKITIPEMNEEGDVSISAASEYIDCDFGDVTVEVDEEQIMKAAKILRENLEFRHIDVECDVEFSNEDAPRIGYCWVEVYVAGRHEGGNPYIGLELQMIFKYSDMMYRGEIEHKLTFEEN